MAQRRVKPGWIVVGGALVAALVWFGSPPLFRQLEFFRVRRVEVRGVKYLDPRDVATGLKLAPRASVFDPIAPLQQRARALPGVVSADVSRRPPGTLRVTLEEVAPVALVPQADRLRPVGADGKLLPFDAALAATDLPLTPEPDSLVTGLLARLRDADASLYGQVVSGRRVGGDVVVQVAKRRYWFRPDATAEVIRAVTAVAQDLAKKGRSYQELDARFSGYVVVRGRSA